MRQLVTVLIALWLGPNSAFAQVINACVKLNGNVRVVADPAECHNNETPLAWNQQGPPGEMGDPGEPGEPGEPAAQLIMKDGNGNTLGPVISYVVGQDLIHHSGADYASFLSVELGVVVSLAPPSAFVVGPDQRISYTDEDCLGQAYIQVNSSTTLNGNVFIPNTLTTRPDRFFIPTPVSLQNVSANSRSEGDANYLSGQGSQNAACENVQHVVPWAQPLEDLTPESIPFLPIAMPVTIEPSP